MLAHSPSDLTQKVTENNFRQRHLARFVLLIGLLVGTLDGIAAVLDLILTYHGDPNVAFQYIASGVFGKEAIGGGMTMTLWGILFHYAFALWWTFLFFILWPKVKLLRGPWYVVAPCYALVVWVGMNLIVRPLSAVPHIPWTAFKVVKSPLILVVTVGSPISFAASRFFGSD